MKRIASITCLIFTLSVSFAQGYDWVKTLHGTSTAGIGHMMLDGYGNIYLNGGSRLDLMLDTLTVWPLQANNGYAEPVNSMMKISPDGDLVWSKQLYGHNELVNQSWPSVLNMKMSGDTSAMLLIDFFFPSQPRYRLMDSLFIIDTLLFADDTGFLPCGFFDSIPRNVQIGGIFTLSSQDGHIEEFHTIECTKVGSDGRIITDANGKMMYVAGAKWTDFCIDRNGNFIGVSFGTNGIMFNNNDGAIRYMVDHNRRFDIPVLREIDAGNNLLIKFSRHFDTIQSYTYMFDSCGKEYECLLGDMKIDADGNVYLAVNVRAPVASLPLSLSFNGADSLIVDVTHNYESFVVKYDSFLVPQWVKQFGYDAGGTASYGDMENYMHRIAIDEDSSSVFVLGYAGGTAAYPFYGIIDTTIIQTFRSAVLYRFRDTDGKLMAYGKAEYTPAPGEEYLSFNVNSGGGDIVASAGRVFTVLRYDKSFVFGDTTIYKPDTLLRGFDDGIATWDYACKAISFMDFQRNVQRTGGNRFFAATDSSLIVSWSFIAGEYAWFGDTCVMANDDIGVIARYVDPAYAIPYGQQPVAVPYIPLQSSDMLAVWPNPTHNVVHLACRDIKAVWLVVADGRRTQLPFKDGTVSLKAFAPGLYVLEVQTDDGFYKAKVVRE